MIIIELVNKTIGECLKEQAKQAPNEIALEYEDEEFSWGDLDLLSDHAAIIFMRHGIKKGSHVGLFSTNSPNWIITFFGLVKIGAIPILINTLYKEIELSRVLDYADVEFLCYGEDYENNKCEDIIKRIPLSILPHKEKCIAIGKSDDGRWRGFISVEYEVQEVERSKLYKKMEKININDTAVILFTSGTSKTPKGVMLSHYSLINNSLDISMKMHWSRKDKMCVAVPLYHCFGITASLLTAVHTGLTLHLLKCYRTLDVFSKIDKHKCTILNGVPSMFLAMLYNEKKKEFDLSSIESGIIAGSKISPYEYKNICDTFHFSHLQPSYGQTESSPCITISDYNDSLETKASTSGKKIDHIKLRIANGTTKKELGPGEIGEIQTYGYHVMQGYYKMTTETQNTFTEDGWLKTGDLGYMDDKGYLHITGRITEMIIRGGENISPSEIEECIYGYPNVKYAKVIGIKADVLQEEVAACIVSVDGKKIIAQSIKDFIKKRLSDYKVPKYILQFDKLPYNATGKVAINDLKQKALDIIKQNI